MLGNGTIPPCEKLVVEDINPIPKVQDKNSSAENFLLHVSQLRIHFPHWKPVLDASNVWILIWVLT